MNKRNRMIGEIVLVVAGVLVALMVEAGLASRKDDQLRDEYMSRLQADVAADKQALLWRIEFLLGSKGSVRPWWTGLTPIRR